MKTSPLIQRCVLYAVLFFFLSFSLKAQTLIDFDDDEKWIRGSSTITGYALDHVYRDGLFSATYGEACRITNSEQDGVPGAKGTYAWKLKDRTNVDWRITIESGGVGTFSIDIRRWDEDPGPNYLIDYSIDGGSQWQEVAHINNSTLDGLSEWKTFSGVINSSNDDILIRLKPTRGTDKIMVDNFEWTSFTANRINATIDGNIEIWPNPVSHIIRGKVKDPLARVELVDMAGRKIKGKILSGEYLFSISVNEVKNGIYFVRIIDVFDREAYARVIILH